jgi:HEPN domain-containing protein
MDELRLRTNLDYGLIRFWLATGPQAVVDGGRVSEGRARAADKKAYTARGLCLRLDRAGLAVWDRWLDKAKQFEGYAKRELAEGRYDASAFFAQQAVELLLKGLLLKRTGARPYTHSLVELLQALAEQLGVPVPEEVLKAAEMLEEHYISARYPDARLNEYRRWEAEEALSALRRIWEYVRGVGEAV